MFHSEGGKRVLLIARGESKLEDAKKEIEDLGGEAWIFPADVSDYEKMEEAAVYAEENIGPIEIWVNNAMVSVFSRVADMTAEEYKRVTEVTYLGQVFGTKAALKYMRPRNKGKIALIGSALSFRGIPLQSAYCASKHAIQGFFESLRAELIHDQINVSLSTVLLPAMNTAQFSWVKSHFPKKPQPMGQIFQPEVAEREVVRISQTNERLSMVGFSTFKTVLGNKVLLAFLDYYLARTGFNGQFTDVPEDADRKNNLWKPLAGNYGTHGNFDEEAQNYSIYNLVVNNKKALAFAGLSILGLFMLRKLKKS